MRASVSSGAGAWRLTREQDVVDVHGGVALAREEPLDAGCGCGDAPGGLAVDVRADCDLSAVE
jgi:hypothetical protein